MFYILILPGMEPVYPYTLTDLKLAHQQVSFPNDMTNFDTLPWNCYPVQPIDPPMATDMIAIRSMPELVNGVWEERWVLEPAPPAIAPQIVSMRQARLALLQAGLLDRVDEIITAIEDPIERKQAQITWDYSVEVDRNDPLVSYITAAFELSSAQIDDLLILASQL